MGDQWVQMLAQEWVAQRAETSEYPLAGLWVEKLAQQWDSVLVSQWVML
jgi:hypothetical protein